MFNVGVLAAKREPVLVRITDRLLTWDGFAYEIVFQADGTLRESSILIPGQWYASPVAGIGGQYEVIATLEAGFFSIGTGDWRPISSARRFFASSAGGRVRVQIRRIADSVVVASARFWTPGFAP